MSRGIGLFLFILFYASASQAFSQRRVSAQSFCERLLVTKEQHQSESGLESAHEAFRRLTHMQWSKDHPRSDRPTTLVYSLSEYDDGLVREGEPAERLAGLVRDVDLFEFESQFIGAGEKKLALEVIGVKVMGDKSIRNVLGDTEFDQLARAILKSGRAGSLVYQGETMPAGPLARVFFEFPAAEQRQPQILTDFLISLERPDPLEPHRVEATLFMFFRKK
jgi:hypothetical protein